MDSQDDNIFVGWLYKRYPAVTSDCWQHRWCVLRQASLTCWKDETRKHITSNITLHPGSRAVSARDWKDGELESCTVDSIAASKASSFQAGKPFGFVLDVDPERGDGRQLLYFDAGSKQAMAAWVTAISGAACNLCSAPSSPSSSSHPTADHCDAMVPSPSSASTCCSVSDLDKEKVNTLDVAVGPDQCEAISREIAVGPDALVADDVVDADATTDLPIVLKNGDRVSVVGLMSQSGLRLNGAKGVVMSYLPDKTRWKVRLDGSQEMKLIKPSNLVKAVAKKCEFKGQSPTNSFLPPSEVGSLLGDNCCIICLEELRGSAVTITRCGHIFHARCLNRAKGSACPQCRQSIDDPAAEPVPEERSERPNPEMMMAFLLAMAEQQQQQLRSASQTA